MNNYKFLIILFYYNRPQMVKNALLSIKYSNFYYENWKLLFIDDGSPLSGKEILYDTLKGLENKIEYVNTDLTEQNKFDLGGSLIGRYANDGLKKMDCDYAIMLCDDDALYPNYLYNLNEYFNKNLNDISVYSNVIKFNPTIENFLDGFDGNPDRNNLPFDLNQWKTPIDAFQKLDASQVCWKIKETVESNVLFNYPLTLNLDAWFYKQLNENFGPSKYTRFVSQFKGDYNDTLSLRQWNTNMYDVNFK